MNIAEQIKEDMSKINTINTFVNTNYSDGKRRTPEELAKAMKVKKEDLPYWLNVWLTNAVRTERHQSNIIHKFCIFYDEDHRKPKMFNGLGFTSQELCGMRVVSQNLDLPGYMYVSRYRHLLLNAPDGIPNLVRALHDSWGNTVQALAGQAYLSHPSDNTELVVDEADLQFVARCGGVIGGGQANRFIFHGKYVNMNMSWARRKVDQHAELLASYETGREIICMAPIGETPEQRTLRKQICVELNALVMEMAKRGQYLHAVGNHRSFTDRKQSPILRFIAKGPEMVEMTVTLTAIKDIGKFVLN